MTAKRPKVTEEMLIEVMGHATRNGLTLSTYADSIRQCVQDGEKDLRALKASLADVEAVLAMTRKRRSDAGVPRKPAVQPVHEDVSEATAEEHAVA